MRQPGKATTPNRRPSNAIQQGSVPGVVPQYGQNLDASHGGGLQIQPVTPPVAPSTAGQAGAPTCNTWTHNATMNGCVAPQVHAIYHLDPCYNSNILKAVP